MKFNKFTKLTNTYDSRTINKIRKEFPDSVWVITEKLDGANFSFYYDGTDLRVASRTQFVDGTFFNCQQVINRYEDSIKEFYEQALQDGNLFSGDVLTITGELIGDNINGRVKYRYPEGLTRDFYAFDTEINGESLGYMFTYDNINCVPVAPLIDICTFEEALQHNNTFKSYLSPPDLEINYSEGLSISPVIPLYFTSGSQVWLKSKSSEFKEKGVKQRKADIELSEFDNKRLNDILEYVNENRVISAISKYGEVTHKDFGNLMKIVSEDVFDEFREEHLCDPVKGVEDWKTIIKKFNQTLSNEIRKQFVKSV